MTTFMFKMFQNHLFITQLFSKATSQFFVQKTLKAHVNEVRTIF